MKLKLLFLFVLFVSISLAYMGCSTSKENKTMPKNPIPKPAIAPGIVSVSAKIISVTEVNGKFTSNVRIIKVNEYGMNTKPVAEGSDLVLDVAENLSENIKDNKFFKVGRTAELLLKQPSESLGSSSTPNWNLINIK